MYKIFPIKTLILVIATLTVIAVVLQSALKDLAPSVNWPGAAQIASAFIVFGLAFTWRWAWGLIPQLNQWIFPDLNGEWEVEMESNWSRHEQILEAAASQEKAFDIKKSDPELLRPLMQVKLKAKILQTLWNIEMEMWSEFPGAPIRYSEIISIDPTRSNGLKRCGLTYVYRQENKTDNIADDPVFFGAARVEYNSEKDVLEGEFWTQRMWRRALNTAGTVRLIRVSKKKPKIRRK